MPATRPNRHWQKHAVAYGALTATTLHAWPIKADFGSLLVSDAQATLVGEGPNEQAGWSLAFAGDTDGDGLDDLLVSAQLNDDGGQDAGKVYLILGSPSGLLGNIDLLFADASFEGEASEDYAGSALASGSDLDGDGYDDYLIGAWGQDRGGGSAGKVYLYYGGPVAPGPQHLANAPATFVGETVGDLAGFSLADAGDVTGDGYPDFLIGAPNHDGSGSNSGRVYLVTGGPVRYAGEHRLGQAYTLFQGTAANDRFGATFSCQVDFTGDGLNDPLIGAAGQDGNGAESGAAYLFASESLQKGIVSASTAHLIVLGASSGEQLGTSVAGLHDMDGDGLPELAFGAPRSNRGATWGGSVYLLRSDQTGAQRMIPDGSWTQIYGIEAYGEVGRTLAPCGDFDQDGREELLIGAPTLDDAGEANAGVVGWFRWTDTASQRFDQLPGLFRGQGEASLAGFSLAAQADVDGDARAELLIGAAGAGSVYLFYSRLYFDDDGDGSSEMQGDCDDTSTLPSYPITEVPYDGIDQDCDGIDLTDLDGDGVTAAEAGGTDCNDSDPSIQPFEVELPDGIDQDCDGTLDNGTQAGDDDGDGFSEQEGDCRDDTSAISPDSPELPNGLDDNCNGQVDEPSPSSDQDGDGLSPLEGDCDDTNADIHPGSPEAADGIDQDCDGLEDDPLSSQDLDQDGFTPLEGDSDDLDPLSYPGAPDIPDGIDNDGDGYLDEGTTDPAPDVDLDGYSTAEGDPDDSNPEVYPGAPDGPDGVDNDGDGLLDEDPPEALDQDADGFTPSDGDTDDANPAVYPGAPDLPDGIDNDGDGLTDEDTQDLDGDGYSATEGDCDDQDPLISPAADEQVDGQDQNCNQVIDEGTVVYDDDLDGYSELDDDCNDADPRIHPDQNDPCDGLDNNCNGTVDDTCPASHTPTPDTDAQTPSPAPPHSTPNGQDDGSPQPTSTQEPGSEGPGEWNGAGGKTPDPATLPPDSSDDEAPACTCTQTAERPEPHSAQESTRLLALLMGIFVYCRRQHDRRQHDR